MAVIKIVTLLVYALLAYVALTQPLTLGANLSLGLLVLLALAHLVECVLYRQLIKEAPGSSLWHLGNVFLFGVFHMLSMRAAVRADAGDPD